MKADWKSFKDNPPEYIEKKYDGGRWDKTTRLLLVTDGRDMAVVEHCYYNVAGNPNIFDSWVVSGVSGHEWDFDLSYQTDRLLWDYAPELPEIKNA